MATIKLIAKNHIKDVRISFDTSKPFCIESNVVYYPSLESQSVNQTTIDIETSNKFFPSSLKVVVTATFINSSGAPRVTCNTFFLPLDLIIRPAKPSKDHKYTISLDLVSNNYIGFSNLFPDVSTRNGDEFSSKQELGIEFLIPQSTPVTATVSSKNPKQTFRIKSDGFEELAFITTEIIRRLQFQHVKFDAAVIDRETGLQLKSYFNILDKHHEIRSKIIHDEECLATCMAQLRTAEKRFLIKLKDRNPAPLNDVDLLLHHTSSQVVI